MSGWEKFFWGSVAAIIVAALAGCSAVKAVVDACREGVCR